MTTQHTSLERRNGFRSTWLWQFGLRQLKRSPFLYGLAQRVWKVGDAAFHVGRVYLKAPPRCPLVPLAIHAEKHGKISVFPNETVTTTRPRVFPATADSRLTAPHAEYTFPAIYIAQVSNAIVEGGTNLIRTDQAVLCHDLYDWKRDYTPEELHRRTYVNAARSRISWLSVLTPIQQIAEGACFTDACAPNYAHWLTEVLPRINLFCASRKHVDVPLIVNAGLHPNLMESLEAIAGKTRKLVLLAERTSIMVEELSVLSATGYVPFERRTHRTGSHSHGIFSGYGLLAMRDRLLREQAVPPRQHLKQIFVKRNSSTRTLTNAQEIEDLLVSHGFAVIEPEQLSFKEQVELFANADVIVGPTGAAFANLVFCKPTANVVIMISNHKGLAYWYWQNIACAVKNKITYVIGKCQGVFTHPHSDYTIEPSDLLKAIGKHTGSGPV